MSKKQNYPKSRRVKCPCCGEIYNFEDLIEVGKVKDKQQDILIARKLKEKGYEFGLVDSQD